TILTFVFFRAHSFSLRFFELGQEEAVGHQLKDFIGSFPHARGLFACFAGGPLDIGHILRIAESGDHDIPIVGATASVDELFENAQGKSYVFGNEGIHSNTLMAVLFHGSELHVRCSYTFGWRPVGKTMTITKMKDPYTVEEIDGYPAAEIYDKYLGIPWQDNNLYVGNICEFPLVVEQNGLQMARIPFSWSPDGCLNFAITMHEGDKIRLTYGLPQQISADVLSEVAAYRTFSPEAMLMVLCMNRMIFFRERAHLEPDAFRQVAPQAAFLHGNSELYYHHGAGGELHSALVAMALREGDEKYVSESKMPRPTLPNHIIPLEFRLMTFMRAVTSDLENTTDELVALKEHLEDEVERKTRENESLELHVVQTLAEAIDAKDTYTNGHSSRVAEYSLEIAKRAGYSEKGQSEIYMMGLLHDVGKIGVPDAVINKPGKLTDEEFEQIKNHPVMGARILKQIKEMPKLVTGARWHHERYDGRGYPDRLSGEDIPEEARIIAVADAYDAMTSNRSYRSGMPQEKVREQIVNGKGTQFDPRFADIMLHMIDEDTEYKLREQ
ncbi:MAG: HD domain-containing protein, partial [Lachnospiraceae bacterium]|nr:HD domain-containing protein [Lachnospiraceae bacterium]